MFIILHIKNIRLDKVQSTIPENAIFHIYYHPAYQQLSASADVPRWCSKFRQRAGDIRSRMDIWL
jgi:hypothetical protein